MSKREIEQMKVRVKRRRSVRKAYLRVSVAERARE